MIRVSVIIPVYNVEKYLRRCLDSVLSQTLREIEVICVDDASTDASPAILAEYAAKDPRVRVVRQENAGAGAARNTGLDLASGEYLSFLDSDDFFEPEMLRRAYALARRDRDDVVVFGSDQYRQDEPPAAAAAAKPAGTAQAAGRDQAAAPGEGGSFHPVAWTIRRENLPASQPFSYRDLSGNVFKTFVGWAWDKLFRREFVSSHRIRYQVQRTTNDMLFVYTALVLAERISVLDEVLAHQRRDSSDSLSKTREHSWHCFHDALAELKNRLVQESLFAGLTKDYVNYCLHFSLWNYNTLAEPTKSMLGKKLAEEWFDEFGITGKDRFYFENQKEYAQYREILAGASDGAGQGQAGEEQGKDLVHSISAKLYLPRKFNYIIDQQKELRSLVKEVRSLVQDLHRDNLTLRRRIRELEDKQDSLGTLVRDELRRRDEWPKIRAQLEAEAAGRPVWAIKCPAPDNETKLRWGDYPFALSLKKELEKLGIFAYMDFREDWTYGEWADVVIVLRGSTFYRPDRRSAGTVYIMWNISHPDLVTEAEYELYDVVCVGSEHYAAQLKERVRVPVYPLLQCTDTEIFYPPEHAPEQAQAEPGDGREGPDGSAGERGLPGERFDYIFMGNSRGIARPCVMWAIEEKLPLRIWGSGWDVILKDHLDLIEAPMIENSRIPDLYRRSRAALNDHWPDMIRNQFINNRIFDVLACGLPVISDTFDELARLFPDAVLHFRTRAEFAACADRLEHDYDSVKACVDARWPLIRQEFSFARRARQLKELAEEAAAEKTKA